ncbi:hypothetical protein [Streptomyces sp. NPDC051572]|uniref:hypothetical protein n=1 Tax=Streptomyces sp. NPDC051572 TaxID=3155802 RepID=UPI00344ED0A0
MTSGNGRQGKGRPGERVQPARAGGGVRGRRTENNCPVTAVRVVPLWEGLRTAGVRG